METFLPPSSEWLNLQNSAAAPASLPHLSLPRYALQSTAASTQKRKAVVPAPPVEEFTGRVFRHTQKERMKETVLTNFASAAESLPERAAKSASSWNSSLLYARKQRGPQWDYGTRMYHVDSGSAEYYAGVVPLPPSAKPTPKAGATSGAFNTGSSASGAQAAPTTAGNYDSGRPRRSKAATGNR